MTVSVLVPVLDAEPHLDEVAAAMRAQVIDEEIEFLFVDGGSRDRTRAILEQLAADDPRVRILDNPGRRVPQALNIALRAARGDVVARMDAHTIYPPDYLALGAARLRQGDVAWVSGPQIPHPVDRGSRRVALALATSLGTGGAAFRASLTTEIEIDTGFTGLFSRAVVDALGGWDEGWPVNQDAELGARMRLAGHRMVCVPELAARYVPRSSLLSLARQYARYGLYRAKTSRRHPSSMRRGHVLPPAVVMMLAVAALPVPRRLRRPARVGAGIYGAALAVAAGRLRGAAPARDVACVPAVLAAMHVTWGAGFLVGCARFGPPVAAVAQMLRVAARRRHGATRRAR